MLFLLKPFFTAPGDAKIRAALAGGFALSVIVLILLYVTRPAGLGEGESALYASGVKNLWQLVGATLAVWLAFEVDTRWTHFEEKAPLAAQLLKIAGGSLIVLGLQVGVQKLLHYEKPITADNVTRNGIIACLANFLGLTGGIACGVDDNGVLKSVAYDQQYNRYEIHPNGHQFAGTKIPGFQKAKELVYTLHRRFGHFRIISWDIAIAPDHSPVIIEFNLTPQSIDLHQINNGPLFGDLTESVLMEAFGKRG